MKTEFQKCMDGEIFDGKDKELAEMTLKTKRLLVKLNSTDYADTKQKEAILREMFGHLGENVHVDIDFRCEYGKNIFVGNKGLSLKPWGIALKFLFLHHENILFPND